MGQNQLIQIVLYRNVYAQLKYIRDVTFRI